MTLEQAPSSPGATQGEQNWRVQLQAEHAGCFACDAQEPGALGLVCTLQADGSVAGVLEPRTWMHGYPDRLHGGLVATLLDSAMTQCLFAHGICAVTATLYVRYRDAVTLDQPLHVKARLEKRDRRVYDLCAELSQQGRLCANAQAKFMNKPTR